MPSELSQPYSIIDGPSKYDLMLALFDGASNVPAPHDDTIYDEIRQRTVRFTTDSNDERRRYLEMQIDEIGRENGSGESWNFSGYAKSPTAPFRRVQGYYSTARRRGTLRFEVTQ